MPSTTLRWTSFLVLSFSAALACVAPIDDDATESQEAPVLVKEFCVEDQDCHATCQRRVADEIMGREEPEIHSSRCELVSLVGSEQVEPAPTCLCFDDPQGEPVEVLSPKNPDPCAAYGKDRSCVMTTSEVPTCDLNSSETSCQTTCQKIQSRRVKDGERSSSLRLRGSVCESTGCHCVVEASEKCFVDQWFDEYDCRLDNHAIVKQYEALVHSPTQEELGR